MKMFPSTCRISNGLHAFVIQFYLLTVATSSTPESIYCGSSGSNLTHASCSRQVEVRLGCEEWLTSYNISTGNLFDTLMDESNCIGEFILGKTGFNLTILQTYDLDTNTVTLTHCEAGFDPHRTWDDCSDLNRPCPLSVEVCDADRPGENCFTTDSTHVNGNRKTSIGSVSYAIFSVFLHGQLPCTRCLLQMRIMNRGGPFLCTSIAIKTYETPSKDEPDGDHTGKKGTNSGNYNTQVGHTTIFFSTILTFIVGLV